MSAWRYPVVIRGCYKILSCARRNLRLTINTVIIHIFSYSYVFVYWKKLLRHIFHKSGKKIILSSVSAKIN